MTPLYYVFQSIRYRWIKSTWFGLGILLASLVVAGSLGVGDTVKNTLASLVDARLGKFTAVVVAGEHHFRDSLAGAIAMDNGTATAPVLTLRGSVTRDASTGGEVLRAGGASIYGVDDRFWTASGVFTSQPNRVPKLQSDDTSIRAAINESLAKVAGIRVGDEIVVSVEKPTLLSRDAPLATIDDAVVTFRVLVERILTRDEIGQFGLSADQESPRNLFLPLTVLQRQVGLVGKINMLLFGQRKGQSVEAKDLSASLFQSWDLLDADLEIREIPSKDGKQLDLRTGRVFLDPHVVDAALKITGASPALTYFVNRIAYGAKTTPYSMVTATDMLGGIPDGGIVVNRWLADDLGIKVGDVVKLDYWLLGSNRALVKQVVKRTVTQIVAIAGVAADRELMPILPGLSDKKDCREWEPGVPIDLELLRDKDQVYWETYKGTPKAFISLKDGQKLWGNRFGNLTAVRFPQPSNTMDGVQAQLRRSINPAALGLFVRPLTTDAKASAAEGLDFGWLFLSLGLFLLVAAGLLITWLVRATVDDRAGELHVLRAAGVPERTIRFLFLSELLTIAVIFGSLGAFFVAPLYTAGITRALMPIWGTDFSVSVNPMTPFIGLLTSACIALLTILVALRRPAVQYKKRRLATRLPLSPGVPSAIIGFLLTAAIGVMAAGKTGAEASEYWMTCGIGVLICCVGILRFVKTRSKAADHLQIRDFVGSRIVSNINGYFTNVMVVALASYLVLSVGANQQMPPANPDDKASGTGGYRYLGVSSLPLYGALESKTETERLALDPASLTFSSLPMRLREGDDATCLNLNKAKQPSILGVDSERLAREGRFSFVGSGAGDAWKALTRPLPNGEIPVVADENTVLWSLQKTNGALITIIGDQGSPVSCRIVGVLKRSVLQGSLIMDENTFITLFPNRSGYRKFLIASGAATAAANATLLTSAGEPFGLAMTRTTDRLADFASVENTYVAVFSVLGGLGLLIGVAGSGVIVKRVLLSSSKETALLLALGLTVTQVCKIRLREHRAGSFDGLIIGLLAGMVACTEALRSGLVYSVLTAAIAVFILVMLVVEAVVRFNVYRSMHNVSLSRILLDD